MRLVAKLTLGLLLGLGAILALHAWVRVERERHLIEADIRREQERVGQTLALLLPPLQRAAPAEAAAALQALEAAVGVTVQVQPGTVLQARDERIETIAGERRLITRIALPAAGGPQAIIELSNSLAGEAAYLRDTLVDELITMAALGLTAGLIAAGLGVWLVGRPSRRLLEQAARIGAGDFAPAPAPRRRDELADLAAAMNATAARLASAQAALAAETAERIAALDDMRRADRLATVGTLAASVAQELGNPLTIIAEHGRLLARDGLAASALPAVGQTLVDQADRMTASIRRLLDFARRSPRRRGPADLRDIAARSVALLHPLARGREVRIGLAGAAELRGDALDAGQLQQAVTNLLINALHAEPRGGSVRIELARGAAVPAHDGRTAADCLQITVADHGAGIDPALLPRVFEPFVTTKPVEHGTGLGLAVAQRIVADHGGWIALDSAPGRGTRATIVLPVAPGAAPGGAT
jgi:two-component system NtrC family sensor kinase